MRVYLEFAKKSFQNNIVYRMDYFAGVINALVMIFVNISIWKAIYEEEESLEGVQFKIVATYIVLSFLMQVVYTMDEYFIEGKVRSGLISSDLMKPINFRLYVFSYNIGTMLFRLLMQLLPALLVSIFLFKLLPPFSTEMLIYFIVSSALGYLVLYNLNFIVWSSTFWFYWTFSLVTIKDAAVMIFSGALIPLWFMPQWLIDFIKLTPFDSIFYTPIRIYLGQIPHEEIWTSMLRQVIWVVLLFAIGQLLWKAAAKKLVVQGG
ncbi:ABC-2 family transporter protein [Paenibacillus athensensis]|uniref:ABC transporter permease n=1 Tax=Paenibacillus athensensis TaxID=1967502 RepID=A0A4Y8Q2A1_9BACL|nr:ABC-2 family transporter protein [Paenibacillus athensensis]MCD1258645.1 ABC-2 family transporter protein [Paenibacillus athensensis]